MHVQCSVCRSVTAGVLLSGRGILTFWRGRDATLAFNGDIYKHSKAAHNLLPHLRIAKLVEKLE
eukprot:3272590-Rhodomonas_salina.1